jgi:hypothetical protein
MGASKPLRTPDPALGSVLLTERARDHYENHFLPRYKRFLEEVDRTELTVLIWGPGSNTLELYNKRLQIRDELRTKEITALFSEDICSAVANDHSLSAQELAQAKASDLIITIQCSHGSTAEVHDFGRLTRTVASQLVVFIDKDAINGYSYRGLLKPMKERFNNVYEYTYPDDITQCNLLTKVLDLVKIVRETKWIKNHE